PTCAHGGPQIEHLQKLEIPIVWRAQATNDLQRRGCRVLQHQLECLETDRLVGRNKQLFELGKFGGHHLIPIYSLREQVQGGGGAVDDALDGFEHLFAHLVLVGADGELEGDLVGDDVVLGAAVDRADGDDDAVGGFDLAAGDGLEVHDRLGGDDDRVFGVVG